VGGGCWGGVAAAACPGCPGKRMHCYQHVWQTQGLVLGVQRVVVDLNLLMSSITGNEGRVTDSPTPSEIFI